MAGGRDAVRCGAEGAGVVFSPLLCHSWLVGGILKESERGSASSLRSLGPRPRLESRFPHRLLFDLDFHRDTVLWKARHFPRATLKSGPKDQAALPKDVVEDRLCLPLKAYPVARYGHRMHAPHLQNPGLTRPRRGMPYGHTKRFQEKFRRDETQVVHDMPIGKGKEAGFCAFFFVYYFCCIEICHCSVIDWIGPRPCR